MKILFLPSSAQRRRRNGELMPNRLFLADGTELKGLTHLEAVIEPEWDTLESTDITASTQQPIGRSRSVVTKLTLTFGPSKVVRVNPRADQAPALSRLLQRAVLPLADVAGPGGTVCKLDSSRFSFVQPSAQVG
jgi:hypothetical protein